MSEPFKLAEALTTYPDASFLDAFIADAIAQLAAQEDAYLLEILGSVENVIAASRIYEVVYEPLEVADPGSFDTNEVTLSRKMWFRKREQLG